MQKKNYHVGDPIMFGDPIMHWFNMRPRGSHKGRLFLTTRISTYSVCLPSQSSQPSQFSITKNSSATNNYSKSQPNPFGFARSLCAHRRFSSIPWSMNAH